MCISSNKIMSVSTFKIGVARIIFYTSVVNVADVVS